MRANAWTKTAECAAMTDVRRQRQVRPGARRRSVDRGDGRHRAVVDRIQHRLVLFAQDAFEVGGIQACCVAEESWPEQKPRPAPVSTMTHARVLASVTAAVISRRIVAFSAFMTSGRLRVMVAMPPSWLRSIVW